MNNNTEERIVSEKEVNDTMDAEATTDTSEVTQKSPFLEALELPPIDVIHFSLMLRGIGKKSELLLPMPEQGQVEEPSQTPIPEQGQTEGTSQSPSHTQIVAVPSQLILPMQTVATAQVATQQNSSFESNKDYIQNGQFGRDIANNAKYANRKTGFPNMDAIHSFQPGLYLIMAETSAGKTTFVLQWADQAAFRGEYVLYFALEQGRMFLMSKSISRQFFLEHHEDAIRNNGQSYLPLYTSLEIRNNCVDGVELNKRTYDYIQQTDDRMHVVSTNFNGNINAICECIDQFIEEKGHKPVAIIDYFQIVPPVIAPNGMPLDSKANIDQGIHKLKQFQEERDLTVMVISSVSRVGYSEEISLAHAKESGALEYTCDFAIGMQLRAVHECINSMNGMNGKKRLTDAEKRRNIMAAKAAFPRKIEAVYLKDRCGAIGSVVYFDYYSAYETFIATDENGNPM